MTRLTASLNVPLDVHQRTVAAARQHKIGIGEYSAAALEYFNQRKLNPVAEQERQTVVLVEEMRKVGNRLFGFLQEQERGVMWPILEELVKARLLQEEVADYSLQILLAVFKESDSLEKGRSVLRERVSKRVAEVLQALHETRPGKGKN